MDLTNNPKEIAVTATVRLAKFKTAKPSTRPFENKLYRVNGVALNEPFKKQLTTELNFASLFGAEFFLSI